MIHRGKQTSAAKLRRGERFVEALDHGVRFYVEALRRGGIETYESCEGGQGHTFPEPTIRFHGDRSEGFRALDVAMKAGLPVMSLRRFWSIIDGEPVGPHWEMTFRY
jgi:hypothetical protein